MKSVSSHPVIEPDFSHIDSAEDIIRDAQKLGIMEELWALLCKECGTNPADPLTLVRKIAYEFSVSKNPDLTLDLLIHALGISELAPLGVRGHVRKHGCTYAWFCREVRAIQKRIGLHLLLQEDPDEAEALRSVDGFLVGKRQTCSR